MKLGPKERAAFNATKQKRQAFVQELNNVYQHKKVAQLFSMGRKSNNVEKKASSNPELDAVAFVSGILASFKIEGSVDCRPTRIDRQAGFGAHGITTGKIIVQADIKPYRGASQCIEIPVVVREGYLQHPSVFYANEVPYIIAQSSLDDVLERVSFNHKLEETYENMYSAPNRYASAETSISPTMCTLNQDIVVQENAGTDDETNMILKSGSKIEYQNEDENGLLFRAEDDGTYFYLDDDAVLDSLD